MKAAAVCVHSASTAASAARALPVHRIPSCFLGRPPMDRGKRAKGGTKKEQGLPPPASVRKVRVDLPRGRPHTPTGNMVRQNRAAGA